MHALAVLTLVVALGASCGHRGDREASRSIAGGSYADIPECFDACPDGAGGVVSAWIANDGDYSLRVSRLDSLGTSWSPPRRLWTSQVPIHGVYLAAHDMEIHLFFARNLRHLLSRDSGRTWTELRPALADSTSVVYSCGIAIRDEHRIDLVALKGGPRGLVGPTPLIAVQLQDGAPGSIQEIGVLPEGFPEQPQPVLIHDSLGDAAFLGFNHAPRVPVSGPGGSGVTTDAGIVLVTRTDPSSTWKLADVVAGEVSTRLGRLSDAIGTIGGVGVVSDSNAFGVIYQSDQPYLVRRRDPYHWSQPERLATGRKNWPFAPELRVLFHPAEHRGYVAWIDATRQRHSMRFIFIDTWANNDLALSSFRVGPNGRVDVEHPTYLTRDRGFVRHLQLVESAGHDYVVWIGKARVGKSAGDGSSSVDLVARRLD